MPSSPGLQTFLRLAGLYGPQDDASENDAYMGMPQQLPTKSSGGRYNGPIDEEVEVGQQPSTLDAFRQNVLNPPQRKQMTYPKGMMAGVTKAFEIAAEPSPLDKNRVFVNGKPYQKQNVRTDPVTGEKQFITSVKDPSFMSQVMRAMPASVAAAPDILNQQREDEVEDWKMKNAGLKEAVGAESQMALAGQRQAQTAAIPRGLDIKQMDAETRQRVAALKDLPDSERLRLLQEGKISLADLNNLAAMQRTEAQQTGANSRTAATVAGAGERNAATITGANQRNTATIAGANQRNTATIAGANERNEATIAGAGERNTASIAGRAANSGVTSQLPTQQLKAYQIRANQAVQDNPKWKNWMTTDSNGMVQLEPPSTSWFDPGPTQQEYDEMVNYLRNGKQGASVTTPTTTTPPKVPTTSSAATTSKPPAPSKNTTKAPVAPDTSPKKKEAGAGQTIKQYSPSRDQTRISTDGGKTWKIVSGKG